MHIVSITKDGVSIVGPFGSEEHAAAWGRANIEDPRWNVADIGHPAQYGMVEEHDFVVPSFVIQVTAPPRASASETEEPSQTVGEAL